MNNSIISRSVGTWAIGLGVLLLVGAGCGDKTATIGVNAPDNTASANAVKGEPTPSDATPASQPVKRPTTGSATAKPTEIITEGETAKLPAEFPSSFPIMPGATLDRTYTLVGSKILVMTVEFILAKSVDDGIAYYRSTLPGKGWVVGEVSSYVGAQVMPISSGSWNGHLTFGNAASPFVKVELSLKK